MNYTICIIDDDMHYKLQLKKNIKNLPISVDVMSFSNGKDAYETFSVENIDASELPDVILLDINMPIMDGWEFMDAIVKILPTLPKFICIYIATSSNANHDFEKSKRYEEIMGYLAKPIDSETLYMILKLAKKQQHKELITISAHQRN